MPVELHGLRTLVIDDNATNRLILREMLNSWGAKVSEAENGKVGLDAIETADHTSEPFQLILLDGKMPVMDGFETIKEIKNRFGHLQQTAMLLTSDDSSAKISKAKENGVSVCLINVAEIPCSIIISALPSMR